MLRSMLRMFFTLAMTLSLALGIFSGVALAASQPPTVVDGYHPVASTPVDMSYCYPSGYNKAGWRCGWRLAMAPYNLGSCGYYYGGYCGGYNGYNNGYYNGYSGYGGRGNNGYVADYGGRPRYDPCYYNSCYNYNYNNCYTNYNSCSNYSSQCGCYR